MSWVKLCAEKMGVSRYRRELCFVWLLCNHLKCKRWEIVLYFCWRMNPLKTCHWKCVENFSSSRPISNLSWRAAVDWMIQRMNVKVSYFVHAKKVHSLKDIHGIFNLWTRWNLILKQILDITSFGKRSLKYSEPLLNFDFRSVVIIVLFLNFRYTK